MAITVREHGAEYFHRLDPMLKNITTRTIKRLSRVYWQRSGKEAEPRVLRITRSVSQPQKLCVGVRQRTQSNLVLTRSRPTRI